jgi:hypothetical protein
MTNMRWTGKLTGKFATELVRQGYKITDDTVGRILKSGADVPRPPWRWPGASNPSGATDAAPSEEISKAPVHQFCSQLRRRLRRPVQLRRRVSPSLGIHQFVEGLEQAGLGVGQRLVATASPDRPRICPVPSQTMRSLPDQRMAEPCRRLNASGPPARATAPSQSEANATAVVEDIRSLVLRHRGRSRRR